MENEESSQKNITDKWLDNIFESLVRMQYYERLMKEGCGSLSEYIERSNADIVEVQYKNYKLFITEAEILIEDSRHLIEKKQMLQISILLSLIKNYEKKVGSFLEVHNNFISREKFNILRDEYFLIFPSISRLRGMFVSSLWKLLSPSAKENLGGLPE